MSDTSKREAVAKALDALGVTVVYADDPVDGSRIQVVHLDDLARIGVVFEQAHTPTDDERDGVAKALCAIETRSKAATLEEVQAGIQRWMRHRYEAERLIEELADAGFEVRRTVQGEPSEPWMCATCGGTAHEHSLTTSTCVWTPVPTECWTKYGCDGTACDLMHREPPGEPTDALRDYLRAKGLNPNRMGNWDTGSGVGLAQDAFLAGWAARGRGV